MLGLNDHPKTVQMSGQSAITSMAVDLAEVIPPHGCGRMNSAEKGGALEVLPKQINQ
jgi:hypothetical protein